jgi:hypothetical protein
VLWEPCTPPGCPAVYRTRMKETLVPVAGRAYAGIYDLLYSIVSLTGPAICGIASTIWRNIMIMNMERCPRLPSPYLKKKLVVRHPWLDSDLASVWEIIDSPVPAIPDSQNIDFELSVSTYWLMSLRSWTHMYANPRRRRPQ